MTELVVIFLASMTNVFHVDCNFLFPRWLMFYVECHFLFWSLKHEYLFFDEVTKHLIGTLVTTMMWCYYAIYLDSAFHLWIWSTGTNYHYWITQANPWSRLKYSFFLNFRITILEFHLIPSLCYSASLRRLDNQPEWLKGGKLRDYQLEGLNFLVNGYVKSIEICISKRTLLSSLCSLIDL